MTGKPREKMFVEILRRLRSIIEADRLQAGDKLPSERELSERLNVGRSSVREALRAVELLGLIETRRGEGTYINEAKNHRLVEVLASFILNDTTTKEELAETRFLIEKNAVQLASVRRTNVHVDQLSESVEQMGEVTGIEDSVVADRNFFKTVMEAANNSLLYRLWIELIGYDHDSFERKSPLGEYEQIISIIKDGTDHDVLDTLERFQRQ
jgi:GntR family transcriptional repressor for pyruvate dehydrogenase complex